MASKFYIQIHVEQLLVIFVCKNRKSFYFVKRRKLLSSMKTQVGESEQVSRKGKWNLFWFTNLCSLLPWKQPSTSQQSRKLPHSLCTWMQHLVKRKLLPTVTCLYIKKNPFSCLITTFCSRVNMKKMWPRAWRLWRTLWAAFCYHGAMNHSQLNKKWFIFSFFPHRPRVSWLTCAGIHQNLGVTPQDARSWQGRRIRSDSELLLLDVSLTDPDRLFDSSPEPRDS